MLLLHLLLLVQLLLLTCFAEPYIALLGEQLVEPLVELFVVQLVVLLDAQFPVSFLLKLHGLLDLIAALKYLELVKLKQ